MQHRNEPRIGRRAVTKALTVAAAAAITNSRWIPDALAPVVSAQAAAGLKDVVPNGWLIGVAINQNQSDARDTMAVDLITRHAQSVERSAQPVA